MKDLVLWRIRYQLKDSGIIKAVAIDPSQILYYRKRIDEVGYRFLGVDKWAQGCNYGNWWEVIDMHGNPTNIEPNYDGGEYEAL